MSRYEFLWRGEWLPCRAETAAERFCRGKLVRLVDEQEARNG